MAEHYTEEGTGFVDATGPDPVGEARKRHHLATADPEVDREDGTLTGPAHEAKYGLDRAVASAALWRSVGVHPTENRALVGDEDGAENVRGIAPDVEVQSTSAGSAPETASAPRASDTTTPAPSSS
ncbi:MAG: hypothetical protein NVSMB4_03220 [Acidimicrobiales bacterium]